MNVDGALGSLAGQGAGALAAEAGAPTAGADAVGARDHVAVADVEGAGRGRAILGGLEPELAGGRGEQLAAGHAVTGRRR